MPYSQTLGPFRGALLKGYVWALPSVGYLDPKHTRLHDAAEILSECVKLSDFERISGGTASGTLRGKREAGCYINPRFSTQQLRFETPQIPSHGDRTGLSKGTLGVPEERVLPAEEAGVHLRLFSWLELAGVCQALRLALLPQLRLSGN